MGDGITIKDVEGKPVRVHSAVTVTDSGWRHANKLWFNNGTVVTLLLDTVDSIAEDGEGFSYSLSGQTDIAHPEIVRIADWNASRCIAAQMKEES